MDITRDCKRPTETVIEALIAIDQKILLYKLAQTAREQKRLMDTTSDCKRAAETANRLLQTT